MGKYRKRFNEKARSGMLAKQAELKKVRNKQFTRHLESEKENETKVSELHQGTDSNAEVLQPMTQNEKDDRKRAMEQALYSENEKESKMSRSKKKRLDKYIEHQLKREEKKTLFEKLAQTQMDTSLLAPSKLLGSGKQTRREQMIEALELERQGRGNEQTKAMLYEVREVKEWPSGEAFETPVAFSGPMENGSESEGDTSSTMTKPSFVDNRPQKFGGSGSGFGFSNIPKIEKDDNKKKKYTWKARIKSLEKSKSKKEEENDFLSSSDEHSTGDDDDDNDDDDDDDDENDDGDDNFEDFQSKSGDDDIAKTENTNEATSDSDGSDASEIESVESSNRLQDNSIEAEDEIEDEEEEESEDEEDDEDSEDADDDGEGELPRLLQNKPQHSEVAKSFKEWAEEQVREMEGRNIDYVIPKVEGFKATVHKEDLDTIEDDDNFISIDYNLKREAFHVDVERSPEVQQQRVSLPVYAEEHKIMEAIHHHDCVILCGETGSGKTTQVPQFLYEAGMGNLKSNVYPGIIGITQPRRVAALSMAERVSKELGNHGHRVAHQIRFDSNIKNEGQENGTAMKFMTDGVLLREMMTDFMLKKYSCVIIDEAHERNINTDILIGMLSRLVKLRRSYHNKDPKNHKPLKLVIMSATLRVTDFSENKVLFKTPPPIINVQARQFPVNVHFSRRTNYDYMEEAYNKTCKIHRRLPPGSILIFCTGQNEIVTMVKRLRKEFPFKSKTYDNSISLKYEISKNADAEPDDFELGIENDKLQSLKNAESDAEDSESEEEGFEETLEPHQSESDPLYVLPLYSLLPTKEQVKVFQDPPKGSRMCIVATNVAETSLTIPGVRYVVDCGRSKQRKFNEETNVQSFEVDWVSKASADQRAGRAGRTGPGHCYRLYSSAVFEDFFPQFSIPEILSMPFESVVLSMKSMGIDRIVNFPFPTPPDRSSLARSEKLLAVLGALDKEKHLITDLGRKMAMFPLSPRFAKILIVGNQLDCLPYVVSIVSALSVGDPFINEFELGIQNVEEGTEESEVQNKDSEAKRKLRTKYYNSRQMFSRLDKSSDVFKVLSAVCAYDHVPSADKDGFLRDHFLRPKVMEEITKLKSQLLHITRVYTSIDSIANPLEKDFKLGIPSKAQISAIKQIVAAGFLDQIAIRGDLISQNITIRNKINIANIPYMTVVPSSKYGDAVDPHVYIHRSSIIFNAGITPPSYIVYLSLNLGANKKENKLSKLRMKPLVDLSAKMLLNIAKNSSLITFSKPLGHPYAPKQLATDKRLCYVVPHFGQTDAMGGVGCDLPAIKVTQMKVDGHWVNM